MQLQRRYSRVALDHLQNPVLHHVLRVWEERRNGRAYPARHDLRPHDFAPHLRHLSLARVTDRSDDFELRIIGDEIVQSYGENFTGRTLSSIVQFVGDAIVSAYHSVLLEQGPVLLHGIFERPRDQHFQREVLLLPVGAGSKVEFVLSAGMLTPRESEKLAETVAA